MKRTIIALLAIALIITACDNGIPFLEKDPGLPNGYTLLVSPEGKYTLKSDDFGLGISVNVWDSKIEAKEYAWLWKKLKDTPYEQPESQSHEIDLCS